MSTKNNQVRIPGRQGDVVLIRRSISLDGMNIMPAEEGRVILARGEKTGHHHSISVATAAIMVKGAERYLRVDRDTVLEHQEHGPIPIARGVYEIVIQREFDREYVSRTVVD